MLDDFRSYVDKVAPATATSKTLLAVSGGVDSMVMLDLYVTAGLDVIVAHVDHHTREGQSSDDARWLVNYCRSRDVAIVVGDYHHEGGAFQSSARDFRLSFFEKARLSHGCTYIATAHHQDDVVETMLLMLARGAGLRGLTSMQPLSGHRLKPLLFAGKARILTYQRDHDIPYRQDTSNDEVAYQRNKVRHEVLPAMVAWRDDIKLQMLTSYDQLSRDRRLLTAMIDRLTAEVIHVDGKRSVIDRHQLQSYPSSDRLLHYMTTDHGWTADQTARMMTADTGATFASKTHECLVDRQRLLIRPIQPQRPLIDVTLIPEQSIMLAHLQVTNVGTKAITIRKRMAGDTIKTTAGAKTLKRLLIDLKVDRWTKDEVLVACLAGTSIVYPLYPAIVHGRCLHIDGVEVLLEIL